MTEVERPIFSIGAVARMLDVAPATIRTWETRYGLVVPTRSAGGQRLYSRAQVEQLRFVKAQLDGGARPSQAHRLLRERLREEPPVPRPGLRIHVAAPDEQVARTIRDTLVREGFEVELTVNDAPRPTVEVRELPRA